MLLPQNQLTLYELQFPPTLDTIIFGEKKKAFQIFWPDFHIYVTKPYQFYESITQIYSF